MDNNPYKNMTLRQELEARFDEADRKQKEQDTLEYLRTHAPKPNMWENVRDVAFATGKGMLSGAESSLNGATLGGYRWLGDKLGLGVSGRAEELQQAADAAGVGWLNRAGQFISEVGGGMRGAAAAGYNLAKQGLSRIAPSFAKSTLAPLTVSGTLESGVNSAFNHDFENWGQVGQDALTGGATALGMGAVGNAIAHGGNKLLQRLGYNDIMSKHATDKVFDAQPRNPIQGSELYGRVEPGITPVQMIKIDTVPELKKASYLKDVIRTNINGRKSLSVNSVGDDLYFSKDVIGRTIKDKRNPYDNYAYSKLDEVVANGHYSGFRPTDAKIKHSNVTGQDVYHSGIIYDEKPYSVEFYRDNPIYGTAHKKYAGQNISPIERHDASDWTQLPMANGDKPLNVMPSKYTLSDLRGPVNPNLQNISNFYEGLNNTQIQHLDNAIKSGAGQSLNKMGSLDNFAHIKNAVGQYPDLRGVNRKMNDVLSSEEQKFGVSPYMGSVRKAIYGLTTDYPYLANSVSSHRLK